MFLLKVQHHVSDAGNPEGLYILYYFTLKKNNFGGNLKEFPLRTCSP